jgi:hypothetical protein
MCLPRLPTAFVRTDITYTPLLARSFRSHRVPVPSHPIHRLIRSPLASKLLRHHLDLPVSCHVTSQYLSIHVLAGLSSFKEISPSFPSPSRSRRKSHTTSQVELMGYSRNLNFSLLAHPRQLSGKAPILLSYASSLVALTSI